MRRGGKAVCLALFGMRNYWEMDDDVVGDIIAETHLLPHQEKEFIFTVLMDYYKCADKGYDAKGFARVERKRFPHLKEEERLMPEMEFGLDRAKQEGMQLGRRQGLRKGKQQGIEQGIEQGKKDMVKRLLLDGVDEQTICRAAQLSKRELAQFKRSIDRR